MGGKTYYVIIVDDGQFGSLNGYTDNLWIGNRYMAYQSNCYAVEMKKTRDIAEVKRILENDADVYLYDDGDYSEFELSLVKGSGFFRHKCAIASDIFIRECWEMLDGNYNYNLYRFNKSIVKLTVLVMYMRNTDLIDNLMKFLKRLQSYYELYVIREEFSDEITRVVDCGEEVNDPDFHKVRNGFLKTTGLDIVPKAGIEDYNNAFLFYVFDAFNFLSMFGNFDWMWEEKE